MKKLTIIGLVLAMCLSLGSCAGNGSDGGNKVSSENGVTENISKKENVLMYLDCDGNYGFDKYDTDGRLVHTAVFDSKQTK